MALDHGPRSVLSQRLSRRSILGLAASLPVLGLIAACGGDDDAESPPTQTTSTGSGVPTTTQPTTTSGTGSSGMTTPSSQSTTTQPSVTPATSSQVTSGGTFIMSYQQAVGDTLNQHLSSNTTSRAVAHHVLDSLVLVNPQNAEIVPWLAKSFEVTTDGKEFTFELRSEVTFHDGTPFNAQAVKANFDYTMNPNAQQSAAFQVMGGEKYNSTTVVDDMTLKVTFNSPYVFFLAQLSDGRLGIDSPTALEKFGEDYGFTALVGTGPYKFVEYVPKDRVVLEKNPDYNWGPSFAKHQGPPHIDRLIFRDIAEAATRASALQNGDVQMAQLVESQATQFKGNNDIALLQAGKAGTSRMYIMNLFREPTNDINVRRAITMSIDRAGLLKLPAWAEIGQVAIAPLPTNVVPNGDLSRLKPLDIPYDPEQAAKILNDAGWTAGSGGIRQKDGKDLVIDFVTTSDTLSQVEPLDGLLSRVGAKLNIIAGDFNFRQDKLQNGEFHMTLQSTSGYIANDQLFKLFHTKGAFNSSYMDDPAVDAEIDAANNATNEQEMWEHVFKAMELILAHVPGSMGWEQQYLFGTRKEAQDAAFSELGFPWLYDVWIKK